MQSKSSHKKCKDFPNKDVNRASSITETLQSTFSEKLTDNTCFFYVWSLTDIWSHFLIQTDMSSIFHFVVRSFMKDPPGIHRYMFL